jgi:periplasmic protein CpxP/Spy
MAQFRFGEFAMPLRKRLIGLGLFAGLAFATAAQSQGQQAPNLSALHDALHLKAGQESAWSAYKASVSPSPAAQQRRRAAAMLFPTISAPRRIDLVTAAMQGDLDDLRRQGDALKTFYATLSPEQQHVFDAQTLPPPADRDSDR